MSGTLTTGFRRRILDYIFRDVPLGFDELDVALTLRVPSANAAVSQLNEPVGMSYARARIALASPNWLTTAGGEMANAGLLYFPTATGNWGVINGWAWVSVEASPIVLAVGTIVQPYRTDAGKRLMIGVQQMSVALYD